MSYRTSPVDPAFAQGPARDLLGSIMAKIGMVPSALKTMAHSPALLEGTLTNKFNQVSRTDVDFPRVLVSLPWKRR